MSESLQKLKTLFEQLFRINAADLDFGIYRIINYRRDQIQAFIDEELLEYRPLSDAEKKKWRGNNQQNRIVDDAEQEIIACLGEYYSVQSELSHETEGVTLLKKHLRTYTRKNTADFFIYKDLKGFLNRELDFYVKNDVIPISEFPLNISGGGGSLLVDKS